MSESATVFVVDQDNRTRGDIRQVVESLELNVREYDSAEAVISEIQETPEGPVGCLVTEISLHGISGLELMEELKRQHRSVPAVIVTDHATTPDVVRAMQLGAITVLEKPFERNEFSEAVRTATERQQSLQAERREIEDLSGRFAQLTDQERTVLRLIVAGHINKQISKYLDVSVRTVESRRQQIFRKTGAKNLGELMWLAIKLKSAGGQLFDDVDLDQELLKTP